MAALTLLQQRPLQDPSTAEVSTDTDSELWGSTETTDVKPARSKAGRGGRTSGRKKASRTSANQSPQQGYTSRAGAKRGNSTVPGKRSPLQTLAGTSDMISCFLELFEV